jgi:hypothetical protein
MLMKSLCEGCEVNLSDQPPSNQWAALKYRGETFAEVWFKPEGQPFGLRYRIPQQSFQSLGTGQRLTIENLLRAVGIALDEVESCCDETEPTQLINGPDLRRPLSPPPQGATHLNLFVTLKQSPQDAVPGENGLPEIDEGTWQFLEERWNAILGLEASVDSLRMTMEGLRSEMDAAARKPLPLEVKAHAVSADVVQWNRAKSRIRYAVPKVREFIHRSTWATGTAERKKLAELFENHIQTRIPFAQLDQVMQQFEVLLKDRQNLYGQGTSVYQECKSILAECQGALRTVQINSAANARKKKR